MGVLCAESGEVFKAMLEFRRPRNQKCVHAIRLLYEQCRLQKYDAEIVEKRSSRRQCKVGPIIRFKRQCNFIAVSAVTVRMMRCKMEKRQTSLRCVRRHASSLKRCMNAIHAACGCAHLSSSSGAAAAQQSRVRRAVTGTRGQSPSAHRRLRMHSCRCYWACWW